MEDGLYAEQVQGQEFEGKDWETNWKPLAKSGKIKLVNTPFKYGMKSVLLAPANGTATIRQQRFYPQKGVRYIQCWWLMWESKSLKKQLQLPNVVVEKYHFGDLQ